MSVLFTNHYDKMITFNLNSDKHAFFVEAATKEATTTAFPYVDLGEDCQNAYCEPLNSACVTKSNSSRVCECANQYVQVNTTSCQEVPKEVTSQSSFEVFVSNEETGNIGEILFDGLSEFTSLFTTTADIIPKDMKIELTIATDKLSLKLLTPVASTVTYVIVLSATTDSGQYAVQQVATVRLNVTTVVTPFTPENIPTFVLDGTRKDALIADVRYLGYLLGNDVYTYGIESSTGNIQTLFRIDGGSGQVVCNQDIQLPNDTVAQEYTFNITAQTDGSPKVTIASVYVLVLRDEFEINVDENVAGIFMQYAVQSDTFEITPTLPTDVVNFTNGSFWLTMPRDYEDPNDRRSKITLSVKTFDNAQQTSMHVVLNVHDVNDVPPSFQDSEYTAFILAGSYHGTIITTVSCTDPDTVGTVKYDLYGNYTDSFHVDELGVVKSYVDLTKSAFGDLFSLNVMASDGKHQSSAVININLIQKVPADKHLNKTFSASIEEEVSDGTYVISVYTANYSDYKFVIRQTSHYLTLNSTTGMIETRSRIDREDPPDVFKLKYQEIEAIQDEDQCLVTILGKLYIKLEDINDNSPQFSKAVYQGEVKEHSEMGKSVSGLFDLRVTDEDIGANANITLTLSGEGSDNFEVKFEESYISLKVNGSLDRENVPYYTLNLTATDPGLSNFTVLNITVTDINDNKPIFEKAVYEVFVLEGEFEKRTILVTVTATDEDEGSNADITYTIIDGGFGLFDINSKGEIYQTQTIDRESRNSFNLTISASDKGFPSLHSTTMVTVTVNDVNDNKPEFENGLSFLYFERPENKDCSLLNIAITANDPDEGDNGTVTYSLNSTTFSITPDSGVITCYTPLDYEKDKEFEFIVTATDNGPEPMSASMTVKVRVTDENDNDPIFSLSFYNTSVSSNLFKAGKLLLAIAVSDEDSGDNADISLFLSAHNDIFNISSGNTGVLRVRSGTNISESKYDFTVTATDKGQPPRSSTTLVSVEVVGSVEDSPINYQNKNFTFFIAENRSFSGEVIGNVKAPVAPENVSYTIVGGTFDGFELIQSSGDLRCNKTVDREVKSEYQIFVKAMESGGISDLTMVTVVVTDVNDNHPQFELEPNRLLFQPFEDIANNTLIVRVLATDKDEGINGTAGLVYKILNTDAQTAFTIDQNTAEIRTTAKLDRETKDNYILIVQVADGGTPILSSTTTVKIQLKDVNDNPPQFNPATYTKRIWENATIGTQLDDQFIFATDLDTEYHGPITYILNTNKSCPFQTTDHVNVTTGEVKGLVSVGMTLDYENTTQYECHVYAVDMESCEGDECQKRLTGTATMTVIILDNNDNAPVFDGTPDNVNVSRDDDIGTVVVDAIMASDEDSGRNGLITFSIVSETDYFLINSTSGEITVEKSLMGLEQDIVILTVEATDNPEHDQPLTAAITIRINITDDNIRPWFIKKNYTASLTEERVNADFRADLTANDSKEGETITCNCTYRIISSGYSHHFAINERTAIVSQVTPVNREDVTGSIIILEIEATDDGEPIKSIKTSLTIRVIDINDNKPYFKNETHRFSVLQTAENGFLIGQLEAFDADEENNSLSVYYHIGDSKRVKLHENGTITVTGSLKNEDQTYYIWFSVVVYDSVDPVLSDDKQYPEKSITLVNITVTFDNPNKHAPKFKKAEYKKDLQILSEKGTPIEPDEFKAIDGDDGDIVTYKITEGNSRDIIHISETTGKMELKYRLDDTVGSQINLTVIAVDNAQYPKTGTCSVRITVTALEPTQCVSVERYKRLGNDSEQKDMYLGLFAAMASLLAIAFVATIVSCYKWRRSLSTSVSSKNILRKHGIIDDKGKLTDWRTDYDRPRQPPSEHPYNSAQRTEFHEGKINPGYVSSGPKRERVPCPPPPSEPEPLPDYDVPYPSENRSTRPLMYGPALRESSRSYQRSRNGHI